METINEEQISRAAERLWAYHHLNHELEPAEAIFALGSHDLRVAERTADLYHQGLAPLVILSGGLGRFTSQTWTKSEAEYFAEVLRNRRVPERAMLLESRSTNTGDNVVFTRALLEQRGLAVRSVLAVQKPYMERRAYAVIRKLWPEIEVRVTSPQLSFEEYCAGSLSRREVIAAMVGDLQRIIEYPQRGFSIPQDVPDAVMEAYQQLVQAGFTSHMIGQ
jgi:uncharacterized SAM-binding protein YcdF (DUF218 family)